MEDFRIRLRTLMSQQDMTAKDLGKKTGINYRTIESWLSSRNSLPRADVAVKIADAIGTTVEYLINGRTNSKSPDRKKFEEYLDSFSDDELARAKIILEAAFPQKGEQVRRGLA